MEDLSLGSSIVIYNNLHAALQELDILFNTNYTELIGYTDFGSEFSQFLNVLYDDPDAVKKYVKDIIAKNCSSVLQLGFSVEVHCIYNEATYDRTIKVDITIYDENVDAHKTYDLSKLLYVE